MKDLNRYVIKRHASDWKDIGLELGLDLHVLNIIRKDNPQDSVTCLQETLDKWLELNDDTTWNKLELALTNVNRANLGLDPVDDLHGKDVRILRVASNSIYGTAQRQLNTPHTYLLLSFNACNFNPHTYPCADFHIRLPKKAVKIITIVTFVTYVPV